MEGGPEEFQSRDRTDDADSPRQRLMASEASPFLDPTHHRSHVSCSGSLVDDDVEAADQRQCRICLETDGPDLIAPCACRGSAQFVHRECLDQWRSVKEGAAFSQCTTCKARYHMSVRPAKLGARAAKFSLLVARDTLALSALTQLCVGLYALAAFVMDLLSGGALRGACGFDSTPKFYYLFGLFIFLFVAGVLGRQISRVQREQQVLVLLTLRRPRRRHRSRGRAHGTAEALGASPQGPPSLEAGDLGLGSPGMRLGRSASSESREEEGLPLSTGAIGAEGNDLELGQPLSPEMSSVGRSLSSDGGLPEQAQAGDWPGVDSPARPGHQGLGEERVRGLARGERQVLLRFRHAVELTPELLLRGALVAFAVGFLAEGLIAGAVVLAGLDGFFVLGMALVSVPTGVLYCLRLLRTVWDSHRCVLTKRKLSQEYVVEDLEGKALLPSLPADKERELRRLGLW